MDTNESEMDDKLNVCPLCFRNFSTISGLKQHWTKSHTDDDIQAAIESGSQSNNQLTPNSTPAGNVYGNRLQLIRNNESAGKSFHQFNIVENDGMGDCLFSSVLHFLRSTSNNSSIVPRCVLELRRMTVNYIMSLSSDGEQLNFDRFRDSIIINLQDAAEFANDKLENSSDEDIQTKYYNYMSTPGIYATAAELCGMAEVFGFSFIVFRQTGTTDFECYDYGTERTTIANRLHLLFTGDPGKGHFRILTAIDDSSSVHIPLGKYKLVSSHTSSRMISIMPVSEFTEPAEVDYTEQSDISSQSMNTTTLDELLVLLARCKRHIKVIKRIPRSARISAALKLASYINDCVTRPDDNSSWQKLLTFSYTALKVPSRTKKLTLTTLVKRNIEKGELVFPVLNKKHIPISLSKRIEHKISDGDVKGAVKLLSSTDTMAPMNEVTLEQLKLKHPPPPEEYTLPEPPDKSTEALVVTEKQVFKMIGKFPNGSSAGIDGILPQHLKDLTSPITGEAGLMLLGAITKLTNFLLSGKIKSEVCAIMYGASLCALNKKEGGIRPIAVGNTFRRLTSKLCCSAARPESADKFAPRQLGFGIAGGCEASVHATRTFIKKHRHSNAVVLKIDFRNAFNEVQRAKFLHEIRANHPAIYPFLWQCYSSSSFLFYGDKIILSQNGAQQGDPCGPLLFCLAIQSVVEALVSEFVVFYLDDGTIAGNPDTVRQDFELVVAECSKIGLHINPTKCELFFCSQVNSEVVQRFDQISPGIIIVNELTLLGAPITMSAFETVFKKKFMELRLFFNRLTDLDNYHIAYYILRNCLSIPKLVFLLRTTPSWHVQGIINEIDDDIRTTIESLTNTQLNTDTWIAASLPISCGGLGIRRVQDIALPAFLSSVNSSFPLMSNMLSPTLDIMEIADYEDGLAAWNCENPDTELPTSTKCQKDWSLINVQRILKTIRVDNDGDRARRLAISEPESGAWLHALPSKTIGTLLDNNVFRICVGLRLGTDICKPHNCVCGAPVDRKGRHGLHCLKSAGRWPRHAELNQIIKRALASADTPASLEPPGLIRTDGRRVDGMSLVPWKKGKTLIWDASCTDTFQPSLLKNTARVVRKAAMNMVRIKEHTYAPLLDQNYHFVPFVVETMGPWCNEAKIFLDEVAKIITLKTHEPRTKSFIQQRISIAIQKGNAASVMGAFTESEKMEEIFYL